MSYNIIFFTESSNEDINTYVSNQILEIQKIYPDINIELVDETDERFYRFSRRGDRLPAILILKNNSRKAMKHAKLSLTDLLDWLRFNLG